MALILIRTVILYLLTLVAVKVMGKRQIGQLQPFELVVILIVSEMATLAMQSNTVPLLNSVVPMLTIVLLELLISLLTLKSDRLRRLLCGSPVALIRHGRPDENAMSKQRIDLRDLQELCRLQGYFDLTAIDTALLETNGQLSVFPKTAQRPLTPQDIGLKLPDEAPGVLLVLDGQTDAAMLKTLGRDEDWLRKRLEKAGAGRPETLFLAGLDGSGRLFWQTFDQRQVEP